MHRWKTFNGLLQNIFEYTKYFHLPVRVLVSQLLLLLLDLPHELLGLLVLAGHDVAHAEVGEHDGGHVQDRVEVLLDDGLVEAGGLLELVLLHEQHVRHVQLPDVALAAELHTLPEYFLNLSKNV